MSPHREEVEIRPRKWITVEQIIAHLQEVEVRLGKGEAVGGVCCRSFGISEQTFYRWKRQYGGLEPDQVRELKQVTEENGRLPSSLGTWLISGLTIVGLGSTSPGPASRRIMPISRHSMSPFGTSV
jgi:putative transposase